MKTIVIVCEGPTEQEFSKDVLAPHFLQRSIILTCPLIKKSGGGIVPWRALRKQIQNHLADRRSHVTTLLDFYGIKDSHQLPGWEESKRIADKARRIDFVENCMLNDVPTAGRRFLPYLQLHEFEGLLFNNVEVFTSSLARTDILNKRELQRIITKYPNPELINDTPDNAPSCRLKKLINGYHKIVYGAYFAKEIGLAKIRKKCPRFNDWIAKLEAI